MSSQAASTHHSRPLRAPPAIRGSSSYTRRAVSTRRVPRQLVPCEEENDRSSINQVHHLPCQLFDSKTDKREAEMLQLAKKNSLRDFIARTSPQYRSTMNSDRSTISDPSGGRQRHDYPAPAGSQRLSYNQQARRSLTKAQSTIGVGQRAPAEVQAASPRTQSRSRSPDCRDRRWQHSYASSSLSRLSLPMHQENGVSWATNGIRTARDEDKERMWQYLQKKQHFHRLVVQQQRMYGRSIESRSIRPEVTRPVSTRGQSTKPRNQTSGGQGVFSQNQMSATTA